MYDSGMSAAATTIKHTNLTMNNATTHISTSQRMPAALKSLWIALLLAAFSLAPSVADAATKKVIGGITVSYSGLADAYYDANDGTLTVIVNSDGGGLSVVVGSTATQYWGDYVDIYIVANNRTLKSMTIKGTASCRAYVCGDVWYVGKFALTYGVIGDTLAYGPGFGLGMGAPYLPASISLKNSYTTAQLFGYPNL